MKLLSISLFAILFLILPVFNLSDVSAEGNLYGNVYTTDFQGRPFPLKGVFINKVVDCNQIGNKDFCQDKSCLGKGFCPSKPQPYYTRSNGNYEIVNSDDLNLTTLSKNGQPAICKDVGFEIACGINCKLGIHQLSAYFPVNFNIGNFPLGIDLRKGHFEAVTPRDQLSVQSSKIVVLTDSVGNQYYQSTYELNNSSNNPNLDFRWVPDPLPVAGTITNSSTGLGVAGVSVQVQNDQGVIKSAVTDSNGKFLVDSANFIQRAPNQYAVRVAAVPAGYLLPTKKTTTDMWANNIPINSPAYESQQFTNFDCAGPDYNPALSIHQTGRCNFKIDPIPPTLAVTTTPTLTSSITPSTTATTSTTLTPTPTVPTNVVFNPTCAAISTTGTTANAILINGIRIDFNSFASISIKLDGIINQAKNFVIPVTINYTNGACRAVNLAINYDSTATAGPGGTVPTTTPPDPRLCIPEVGRPNTCACIINTQCQSQICDPTNKVCISEPFIKTEGGDVHGQGGVKGR